MSWLGRVMDTLPWVRAVRAEQARRDEHAKELEQKVKGTIARSDALIEQMRRTQKALR